jgi:hypothetical protein
VLKLPLVLRVYKQLTEQIRFSLFSKNVGPNQTSFTCIASPFTSRAQQGHGFCTLSSLKVLKIWKKVLINFIQRGIFGKRAIFGNVFGYFAFKFSFVVVVAGKKRMFNTFSSFLFFLDKCHG